MGRGSGRRPLFQYAQFRPRMVELTSQLGSQTGSRGLSGAWQWAFVCCFRTRILAVVLDAAVDAPARPDGAAVPDAAAYGVYPLIILNPLGRGRPLFQIPQLSHVC